MIAFLTLTGHGAAPWMTMRSDDVSAAARTSSGSDSSRWNIVGTMCVWVTPSSAMSRSVSSGVHLSISTTPTPALSGPASEKASGAAWYSGPVHRWRVSPGR